MAEKRKFRLVYAANALLGLLIACGVVIYAGLPRLLRAYVGHSGMKLPEEIIAAVQRLLYFSGVPAIALLALALTVTVNITRGKPFVMANARCLEWMAVCAAVISAEFFASSVIEYSVFPLLTFAVGSAFLLLAVLVGVFGGLFRTAVRYKEENDLTI